MVAADGIREYMFESAGVDTTGASLVSVYSRVPRIEASVIADLDTAPDGDVGPMVPPPSNPAKRGGKKVPLPQSQDK